MSVASHVERVFEFGVRGPRRRRDAGVGVGHFARSVGRPGRRPAAAALRSVIASTSTSRWSRSRASFSRAASANIASSSFGRAGRVRGMPPSRGRSPAAVRPPPAGQRVGSVSASDRFAAEFESSRTRTASSRSTAVMSAVWRSPTRCIASGSSAAASRDRAARRVGPAGRRAPRRGRHAASIVRVSRCTPAWRSSRTSVRRPTRAAVIGMVPTCSEPSFASSISPERVTARALTGPDRERGGPTLRGSRPTRCRPAPLRPGRRGSRNEGVCAGDDARFVQSGRAAARCDKRAFEGPRTPTGRVWSAAECPGLDEARRGLRSQSAGRCSSLDQRLDVPRHDQVSPLAERQVQQRRVVRLRTPTGHRTRPQQVTPRASAAPVAGPASTIRQRQRRSRLACGSRSDQHRQPRFGRRPFFAGVPKRMPGRLRGG